MFWKHLGVICILLGWSIPSSLARGVSTISLENTITPTPIGVIGSMWRKVDSTTILSIYQDVSLYRFVSRTTPLQSRSYEPSPLLSISGSHINEAGRRSMLRSDARDALWELGAAFNQQFGEPLVVVSGYRSAAYQQRLWDLGRCTVALCAPPGQSEHQLGLAVDLFDASTEKDFESNPRYVKYVKWLQQNAHLYGWTQSYQKGEAIDGYEVEPWHWRYIGVKMATRLHNLGWTYTEYVQFKNILARY